MNTQFVLGFVSFVCVMFFSAAHAFSQDADGKSSPFEQVRWVGDEPDVFPEVLVGGVWYRPVLLESIEVKRILVMCEQHWPGKMQRRFEEDLVEAVALMGQTLPHRVSLSLIRVSDGERVEFQDVEMSKDNRKAILLGNRGRGDEIPRAYIDRGEAVKDIEEFGARLKDQFAYLHLKGIDLDAELAIVRDGLADRVSTVELASELHRVISLFGDGHASVRSPVERGASLYPPFLLVETEKGIAAILPDRAGFLQEDRPYIRAIDGVSVEQWLDLVQPWIAHGSGQLIRYRGLRALCDIELLRRRLGLNESDVLVCTMAVDHADSEPVDIEVAMIQERPINGQWPRRQTGVIENRIGYLRLGRMDNKLVGHLRDAMNQFRDVDGLVVDVRGNGGGSRGLLIAFAGYLMGHADQPWVANIARFVRSDRFDADHLQSRSMYRQNDERLTQSQRDSIDVFDTTFVPEWDEADGFSQWHYLVLERTGHEDEYFFSKPIVVLSDAGCFSATDIFLGAMSTHPRVTIMGSASGGGSARSQRFMLGQSLIKVQCASMASLRADGRLYDGRGVEVDIEVLSQPTDFLINGSDTVLDAAVKYIDDLIE